jgi:formate dehydrogenase subunit gamma
MRRRTFPCSAWPNTADDRPVLDDVPFERFAHWLTAVSFVVLCLSGLNITFGKRLLLPLIGCDAFSAFSQAGK